MKKLITIATIFVMAALLPAGCSDSDAVLKYSADSFQHIVDEYPNSLIHNPMTNDGTETPIINPYYTLTADGETALKISHDYELTGSDVLIETPLKPFLDAGLDASKLGDGYLIKNDMLYVTADFGRGSSTKDTVKDSLFDSVTADRSVLTYHQEPDLYGIKLTTGEFEWAKDSSTNDKDLVFVIQAQPLKELGVDVKTIHGWTFETVQEPDGSDADVLLKTYNLGNN